MISASSLVTNIPPDEFTQLSTPIRLIDVRSRFEYRLFHIPSAIHLSLPRILMGKLPGLQNWVLPKWFRELPKDEPIAVICLTSHRSPIAAQQLVQLGFSKVFNITGGMMEWKKLGLPVQSGKSVESSV